MALEESRSRLAILGGAKVSDKIQSRSLLPGGRLLIAAALAYTVLAAARATGKSWWKRTARLARWLWTGAGRPLPVDTSSLPAFKDDAERPALPPRGARG